MIIIYKQDGQIISVSPTQEAVDLLGIHVIAQKDVPAGIPYKYVDEVPEALPDDAFTDGIGGDFGVGTDDAPIAYLIDNGIVITRNSKTGEGKAFDITIGEIS